MTLDNVFSTGQHKVREERFAAARRRLRHAIAGLILLVPTMSAVAGPADRLGARQETPVPEHRWAVLLAGISGDPQLQGEYLELMRELRTLLQESLGLPEDRTFVLLDDPQLDPGLARYKSTSENFAEVVRIIADRASGEDLVFVFLAGHGNFAQGEYKLNLVGPDPSGEDLAAMLYSIPARRFVVVNTTNCSGGGLAALAHERAIVATATASGAEKNRTHLDRYFVEALKDRNGDTDKNGRVSVLEAFTYANKRIAELYEKRGNLRTEHALLDDNGDGKGHPDPNPDNGDGFLARTTYLDTGSSLADPGQLSEEHRALLRQAQAIEEQIEMLKYSKADLPEAEYEKKLESLLLKLAEIHAKMPKE